MATGYVTVELLKSALDIDDTADDVALQQAIDAASRLIDRWCGQRFDKDNDDTSRYFTARQPHTLLLTSSASDLNTVSVVSVTSLSVDTAGNGTFATDWTEDVHFYLAPRAAEASDRPYTQIRTLGGRMFPCHDEAVKVVGTFGWPSVPDEVVQATMIQASVLFKRTTEGAVPIVTMDGATLSGGSKYLDREAQLLLRPYQLPAVA